MITIEKNYLNNKTIIILSICLIVLLFMLFGGFINFSNSIKNVAWLKKTASLGPDYRLLFTFGTCEGEKAPLLISEKLNIIPASPYLAGLAAMRVNNFSLAEEKFQDAIQNDINLDSSASALGVVYYLNNKNPLLIWQQSDISTRFLLLGKECDIAKSNDLATTYYNYALETINLNNRKGYKQLVEFYAETQDEERFKKALESYLKLADPNSIEYHWTLGNVALSRKEYSEAIIHFSILTDKKPNDPFTWYSLGQSLVLDKQCEKARDALDKAIGLNPNNMNFYVYKGHSYLYQQMYDEAGVCYEKALEIDPTSVWAMTHLAEVKIGLEQYDEAMQLIITAMKFDEQAYLWEKAADIAIRMEDAQLALSYIKHAILIEPNDCLFYKKQALICGIINDKECLIQSFLNILRLNPNDSDVLRNLNELKKNYP